MAFRTPAFNDAKTYGYEWLRAMLETVLQEGVLGANDLKCTPAAAGGLRVDMAAGSLLVKGDSGVPGTGLSQGLYLNVNDASIANAVTLDPAHATLPRIDQVCIRVRDSNDLGTGADDATPVALIGTPTSGATLDNRTGAAALPNDHVRLYDVLVPAAATAVTAGNMRDRRPFARGFYSRIIDTGGDYAALTAALAAASTTRLRMRAECTGNVMRVTQRAHFSLAAVAGTAISFGPLVDGAVPTAEVGTSTQPVHWMNPAATGVDEYVNESFDITPAAGSHLIDFGAAKSGTATMYATAVRPVIFIVEEILRPNANNGTA